MMGTVFLQGLHPAQPPCVLGHRITGGQHRRTAARRFAVLVCGRCEQCESAVVLRAGLWCPLASPFVCQTTRLAGARHPDWPDHVGNVCHVGTALGRCQERLTRMTSPFPPTAVIPRCDRESWKSWIPACARMTRPLAFPASQGGVLKAQGSAGRQCQAG